MLKPQQTKEQIGDPITTDKCETSNSESTTTRAQIFKIFLNIDENEMTIYT